MKKQLLKLLLVPLLILSAFSIQAAHIIGGEMTYVCTGPDPANPGNMIYEFTMKVYRDCQGGGADFDSGPNSGTDGTVSFYLETNFLETIILEAPVESEIDPSEANPCVTVPANVCVEEGVYTFTRSLPVETTSYNVIYQRCCRNNSINNILTPGEIGATYYVEITPTAQAECNSSPSFNELPPAVICVDLDLVFDHSATDVDGDQLIYSFCAPLQGGSQFNVAPDPDEPPPYDPVSYVLPNYSELNPMGGSPQVSIDPVTGLITGTPNVQGQFVVGICVEEYRNGELIGRTQRDFQFNVAVCELLVDASLAGVSAGDTYFINSCVDSNIVIINTSTEESEIDEYLWEFEIPDNGVPLPLSFDDRDFAYTFPGPGVYNGTMTLNPGTQCSDSVDVQVTISPPIFGDFEGVYDTCEAGPVEFTDLTDPNGAILETWEWDYGDGNTSDEQNPTYQYDEPGLYDVELVVIDTIGCTDTIIGDILWFPAPKAIIFQPSESVGCPPLDVSFQNLSFPIDTTYDITWSFGDDSLSYEISPDHTYLIPGEFDIHVEVTSPIGCYEEAFFPRWIDVDSLPVANFYHTPPSYISNFNPTVEFTDYSRRAAAWSWKFGDYDSTIVQSPTYTFPDTGHVDVQLAIMHYYGCVDTIVKTVDVQPKVTYFLPNAFTPNNDTKNDEYRGGGYFRGINDFQMTIWDRYGGVVFETNDPSSGWNGRRNNSGDIAPNGVYVCIVRYTGPRGIPHEEKGFATLIR